MAAPVPPSVEQLGERPFSFYPAIIGVDHNEWAFRRATWSEMLVVNRTTKQEVWIPRRLIGEVSRIDEPVVIIGLIKELELKGGMVIPHERRVIEISRALNDIPRPAEAPAVPHTAPVVGIRLEPGAESRVGRMLLTVIAIGILLCIGVIAVLSWGSRHVVYQPVVQNDLGFSTNDDYFSVVNKLGPPVEDKWRSDQGELQYRRLSYPHQGVSIILMGSDRKDMHYVGAMDKDWHVVHSINRNTEAMLRSLRRF
jgi:hypothetical protein